MDLVKSLSFGFVSSVREQNIKLACHLPLAREGFPTGVQGRGRPVAPGIFPSRSAPKLGFVYRHRQLSDCFRFTATRPGLAPWGGWGVGPCCRACGFVSPLLPLILSDQAGCRAAVQKGADLPSCRSDSRGSFPAASLQASELMLI